MAEPKVIISLTSHTKERLADVGRYLYLSIFRHNLSNVKVVLTLFKNDVKLIPDDLQAMIDSGRVELIVADIDLGPHLKYFYAMQKYKDLPVITIDDDSVYPANMVEFFLTNAKQYPNTVIARSAKCINPSIKFKYWRDVNSGLCDIKWNCVYDQVRPDLSAEGYAGIYYPAGCLKLSSELIPEIGTILKSDDIYLSVLEHRNNIQVIVPKYSGKKLEKSTKGFAAISNDKDVWERTDTYFRKFVKEFK